MKAPTLLIHAEADTALYDSIETLDRYRGSAPRGWSLPTHFTHSRLLKFDNGKAFVDVEVAPQKFEKRAVKLGLSDGIDVEAAYTSDSGVWSFRGIVNWVNSYVENSGLGGDDRELR